jgi:site-specific recombinase XerD
MAEPRPAPSFPILLQRFLGEHMTRHRAASPCTVAAYRDTFRLLLLFAERHIGRAPTAVTLADLDAKLILAFLDHLEQDRGNGARSRNARLAAIRSFLRYAVHHDLSAMAVIERALAVPMKRFDRPLLGHLNRAEMQAILDAPDRRSWAGQRDRALLTVMYNTGARVSEVLALRLGDVVLDTTPCAHIKARGANSAPSRCGEPRRRCSGNGSGATIIQPPHLCSRTATGRQWAVATSRSDSPSTSGPQPKAVLRWPDER